VAGIAALGKAKGLAVGAAVASGSRRGKRQVSRKFYFVFDSNFNELISGGEKC